MDVRRKLLVSVLILTMVIGFYPTQGATTVTEEPETTITQIEHEQFLNYLGLTNNNAPESREDISESQLHDPNPSPDIVQLDLDGNLEKDLAGDRASDPELEIENPIAPLLSESQLQAAVNIFVPDLDQPEPIQTNNVPQEDWFITEWNITSDGGSIGLPIVSNGNYNFDVEWGDGTNSTVVGYNTTAVTHVYTTAGIYNVTVKGTFEGWSHRLGYAVSRDKIIDVHQWGNMAFGDTDGHFWSAINMEISATDAPDLSKTTSFFYTFRAMYKLNSSLSHWNTSTITNMRFAFDAATIFNGDLSGWDTSQVTEMDFMFQSADAFNQSINSWKVSQVTNMFKLFFTANSFSQDLDQWDVSSVTNMGYMFANMPFNGNISTWQITSLQTMDALFGYKFNGDVSNWDTTTVISMYSTFRGASEFSGDISSWNTSRVTNMELMFDGAESFDSDISGWDVSSVTTMFGMFRDAHSFNVDITGWDVSKVTDMQSMFTNNAIFNQPIGSWDVSSVETMYRMFKNTTAFNQNLDQWDTRRVDGMSEMFMDTKAFNGNISGWDVSDVNDGTWLWGFEQMFENAEAFNRDIVGWDLNSDISYMFKNAKLFNGDISSWDVRGVTNVEYMFDGALAFNQDLPNWQFLTENDLSHMFYNATSFNGDLSNWGVTNVDDFSSMFAYASSFNGSLANWNTADGDDMSYMFDQAHNFNGNLTKWDVSSVDYMQYMFRDAWAFNQNLSGWNTWTVDDMTSMFDRAYSFNGDITTWTVTNVASFDYMFRDSQVFSQDISGWSPFRSFASMRSMFYNTSFVPDVSLWDISNVRFMDNMFDFSGLDMFAYDRILNSWSKQTVRSFVTFGAAGVPYTQAAARQILDVDNSWTFNDGDHNTSYFVSEWDGRDDDIVALPLSPLGTYDFTIYYGNSTGFKVTTYDSTNTSTVYSDFGTVLVYVLGTIDGFSFANGGTGINPLKLIAVSQWGSLKLGNDGAHFYGTGNLDITTSDTLNTTGVTNMTATFYQSGVDTSGSLGSWDMSSVIYMDYMFYQAPVFNQDISLWNTSQVTTMAHMFQEALDFNQNINSWDVSSVTDLSNMFNNTSSFSQSLSSWITSSVTKMDELFANSVFNGDISTWNVSGVTSFKYMFSGADTFNQDLSGWDVSSATDMTGMFNFITLSIENYDKLLKAWSQLSLQSSVPFGGGNSQYSILGDTYRQYLIDTYDWSFQDGGLDTTYFYSNWFVSTWDTSLGPGDGITLPLEASGTYNFTVYWGDGSFDYIVSSNYTTATHTYATGGIYIVIVIGQIEGWNFLTGAPADRPKITEISHWGTDFRLGNSAAYFFGTTNLEVTATDTLNLTGTTTFNSIFEGSGVSNADFSSWNTSLITDFTEAFRQASSFNGNISTWDTKSATTFLGMFYLAVNFDQPIGGWNTSQVVDMGAMFREAWKFNQDLSSWDTSKVTSMLLMFEHAEEFNSQIDSWDVSQVITMNSMFESALKFNQSIASWNVSIVTNMGDMFRSASVFDQDLSSWNISSVTTMGAMFSFSAMSQYNYDKLLLAWSQLNVQTGVSFGISVGYTNIPTITDARDILLAKSWVFNGDFAAADPDDPVVTSPSDLTFIVDSGLYQVEWIVTDLYPGNYSILVNGTVQLAYNQTTWTNGTTISFDVSGFAAGVYNATIAVYDEYGNLVNDTVIITVREIIPPDVDDVADFSYSEFSPGNNITWTVGDTNPDSYNITRDGLLVDSGTWSNGSITLGIDGLSYGTYTFVITLNDTTSLTSSDTVIVTVTDDTTPDLGTPTDQTIELGALGLSVDWSVGDANPNTYNLTNNGSLILSLGWSNGTISYNLDSLGLGLHILVLTIEDIDGNSVSDTVEVIVEDTTDPTTDSPADQLDVELGADQSIVWTVSDLSGGGTYVIDDGAFSVGSGSWTDGTISFDLRSLIVSSYPQLFFVTLTLTDNAGNVATDTVEIQIVDTTAPDATPISDFSIVNGTINNYITWYPTDLAPDTFEYYVDEVRIDTGSWTDNEEIRYLLDGLSLGQHNITILFEDMAGNRFVDQVDVTVLDQDAPSISSVATYSYVEGSTGNELTWTATDLDPGTYYITLDGVTEVSATSWSSGIPVTYNIDVLPLGSYEVIIYFSDVSGNEDTATTTITVRDGSDPSVNSPADFSFEEGSVGNAIGWLLNDANPGIYSIFLDGALLTSSTWGDGETVSADLDDLLYGVHNLTIMVEDIGGNMASDTVIVTVTDTVAPSVSDESDFSIELGSSQMLSWSLSDTYPATYSITVNGVEEASGSWTNSVDWEVQSTDIGTFTVRITVYDLSGNSAFDESVIIVEDTIAPSITSPEDLTYTEGTTDNSLSWTINDASSGSWDVTVDGVQVSGGNFEDGDTITVTVDLLEVGTHTVVMSVSDTSDNIATDEVIITVEAVETTTTTPTTEEPTSSSEEEGPGFGLLFALLSMFFVVVPIRRRR